MLEALSERLGAIFDRLANRGRLSESDVAEVLREVRVALLEADVALPVAKAFVAAIKEKAVGSDILTSLSPAQSVIKLVYDELVDLLGGAAARLTYSDAPPTVYVMVGLQGSGKTTHAGKLARRLGIPTVIVDTAGRLQIDERLMTELEQIKAAVKPTEILFVADAMTGQEAVNVAQTFNERLGITGVILTKMDGDARGGAALSIHRMTGAPIKFVGVGEKITALEQFYPDRLASRILGMGDVLTLIEKTQSVYSEQQAEDLAQKLRKSQFTLDDFLAQLRQVRKMGSMAEIMKMIPGLSKALPKDVNIDEKDVAKVEAIICSMTRRERDRPEILNGSRRKRIAVGSGTQVADVNRLVKQFESSRQMMKQLGGMKKGRFPKLPLGIGR